MNAATPVVTWFAHALATDPLYDIVSTVVCPQLTERLAMSIDGVQRLDEVTREAWRKLAVAASYRPAFVAATSDQLLARAADEGSERVRRLAATWN